MIELVAERNRWEIPELAAEVRSILDAIDAPPADSEVMFQFQKILYRRKYFDYDARGQIILTCRCILKSEGNKARLPSRSFPPCMMFAAGKSSPTAASI